MARDKLAEIAGIRTRGRGYSVGMDEIDAIVSDRHGAAFTIPPQFVVIRLVTILEVFTRHWATEIIDAGEPYTTRSADLIRGSLKIDFALARALVGKQLSFGELISHELSFKSIGDIERVFSGLIDAPLFDHLKDAVDRWAITINQQPPTPLLSDPLWARGVLARLFEQRHIFVHELPKDEDLRSESLNDYISAASQFVNAADAAFRTLLYGNYPLTQADMTKAAAEDARQADKELGELLEKLDPGNKQADLQASQAAWRSFRDRDAENSSGIKRPGQGSMASQLYSLALERITRARIEQLTEYLGHD